MQCAKIIGEGNIIMWGYQFHRAVCVDRAPHRPTETATHQVLKALKIY